MTPPPVLGHFMDADMSGHGAGKAEYLVPDDTATPRVPPHLAAYKAQQAALASPRTVASGSVFSPPSAAASAAAQLLYMHCSPGGPFHASPSLQGGLGAVASSASTGSSVAAAPQHQHPSTSTLVPPSAPMMQQAQSTQQQPFLSQLPGGGGISTIAHISPTPPATSSARTLAWSQLQLLGGCHKLSPGITTSAGNAQIATLPTANPAPAGPTTFLSALPPIRTVGASPNVRINALPHKASQFITPPYHHSQHHPQHRMRNPSASAGMSLPAYSPLSVLLSKDGEVATPTLAEVLRSAYSPLVQHEPVMTPCYSPAPHSDATFAWPQPHHLAALMAAQADTSRRGSKEEADAVADAGKASAAASSQTNNAGGSSSSSLTAQQTQDQQLVAQPPQQQQLQVLNLDTDQLQVMQPVGQQQLALQVQPAHQAPLPSGTAHPWLTQPQLHVPSATTVPVLAMIDISQPGSGTASHEEKANPSAPTTAPESAIQGLLFQRETSHPAASTSAVSADAMPSSMLHDPVPAQTFEGGVPIGHAILSLDLSTSAAAAPQPPANAVAALTTTQLQQLQQLQALQATQPALFNAHIAALLQPLLSSTQPPDLQQLPVLNSSASQAVNGQASVQQQHLQPQPLVPVVGRLNLVSASESSFSSRHALRRLSTAGGLGEEKNTSIKADAGMDGSEIAAAALTALASTDPTRKVSPPGTDPADLVCNSDLDDDPAPSQPFLHLHPSPQLLLTPNLQLQPLQPLRSLSCAPLQSYSSAPLQSHCSAPLPPLFVHHGWTKPSDSSGKAGDALVKVDGMLRVERTPSIKSPPRGSPDRQQQPHPQPQQQTKASVAGTAGTQQRSEAVVAKKEEAGPQKASGKSSGTRISHSNQDADVDEEELVEEDEDEELTDDGDLPPVGKRRKMGGGRGQGSGARARQPKRASGAAPARRGTRLVICRNCGATETPQWRCGPEGPRTLCNACGVRYKKGLPLAYFERKKQQGAA